MTVSCQTDHSYHLARARRREQGQCFRGGSWCSPGVHSSSLIESTPTTVVSPFGDNLELAAWCIFPRSWKSHNNRELSKGSYIELPWKAIAAGRPQLVDPG